MVGAGHLELERLGGAEELELVALGPQDAGGHGGVLEGHDDVGLGVDTRAWR